jgi:type I restriction enzyme S subunit
LITQIDDYELIENRLLVLEKEFPVELKKSILQAAMQGRLVEQLESEGDVLDLIKEISQEKERLIKEKLLTRPIKLSIITEEEIPFDIPTSWEWMRLNDIADIFNGNSINAQVKKTRYEGLKVGYPYIGTKDVEDNTIVYDNGIKIPYDTSFKVAHKGTTLVCAEGGSAGRKIGFLTEDVCFGNKLFAIQQFKPILNDKFIYYFFQSPLFKTQFNSMITGMIGGVSVSNFKKIIIPIPPLAEQKRIVEKLEQLLPLCDKFD